MNPHHSKKSVIAVALLALTTTTSLLAPSAGAQPAEPGPPVLAYWTASNVIVADAEGNEIRSFPNFRNISLNDDVFAGEVTLEKQNARIVTFDPTTGERLYRIRNSRLPVVTAGGRKVAFFPTFRRDPYGLTVWLRTATGRIRKIVQFATRGIPGIRTGMSAGVSPLDIALDDRGRKMAVVGGLEPLRSFDVWWIDVKTKEATRMTRGENSHSPSVSPDGTKLAVRVESPEGCPDPLYGEILVGKLRVIDPATGERTTLTEYSCDLFYDTPRWIDNDTLIAARITKDPSEQYGYDIDLVSIDVFTGEITEVVTVGNPCCQTVSPALDKIAYGFTDRAGFAMFDLLTGTAVDFPGDVFNPHLSGENRF